MSFFKTIDAIQPLILKYRENKYPFILNDSIKCIYCSQILISAYQTSCGCRYCKKCLDEHRGKSTTKCLCGESENLEQSMPDNAVNREIANMKVSCLCKSAGCKYEDSLKNMYNHQEECEFQSVACPECKKLVTKSLLDAHLEKNCPMRKATCEYCQKSMKLDILKKTHLNADDKDLCEKFITFCPNKCGELNKVTLRDHLLVCKNKPTACPFSHFGCNWLLTPLNSMQHLQEEILNHSTSLIHHFKEFDAMKVSLDNLYKEHKSLKEKNDKLIQEVSSLKREIDRSPRSSSRSTTNVEKIIVNRNGTYIWKIEEFSIKKNKAMNGDKLSVTSEPFYTSEFGYKMSMKIYPAGDGVGKGLYLSVFFTLMKGDYDNMLQWPFKNKVTLTIIDQKDKTNHYSDTFKPDPKSTCYQQPVEEYNIASGSPKFILFEQLNDKYIKKDTIFLKIDVLLGNL